MKEWERVRGCNVSGEDDLPDDEHDNKKDDKEDWRWQANGRGEFSLPQRQADE